MKKNDAPHAEIDMAKVRIEDNIGGLIFAAGTTVIFLIGIPAIREMFAVALIAGCVVALVLRKFNGRSGI